MQVLRLKPHLKTEEISQRLAICTNARHMGYWQILLSLSFNPGKRADEYAQFLGIKTSKVYKIVELYNLHGADFMKNLQWGGRRNETSLLTIQQESMLMESLKAKAIEGKVLTSKDIRIEVENRVGSPVSDDFIWDLFKRHNWKKKMPRPQHPKHNKLAQEEFKKNSRNSWQPTQ